MHVSKLNYFCLLLVLISPHTDDFCCDGEKERCGIYVFCSGDCKCDDDLFCGVSCGDDSC